MAFVKFVATHDPQELPGVTAGTKTTIQNQSMNMNVLYVHVGTAGASNRPTPNTAAAVRVPPFSDRHAGSMSFTPPAGSSIWVWTRHLDPNIVGVFAPASEWAI